MNERSIIALGLLLACSLAHAATPVFIDVSDLDQLRIVNETISDIPSSQDVPTPLTWNTAVTDDFRFDCFTIACETGLWGGEPDERVTRSASSGAVLISPSLALVAMHAPGDGESYIWMTDAGVEVERTRVWHQQVIPGQHDDFGVMKLSSPITNIAPAKILADSAWLNGELVAVIEQDRHINTMSGGSPFQAIANAAAANFYSRPIADGDGLEGGDSGKTAFAFIAGGIGEPAEPVLALSNLFEAGTTLGVRWTQGGNPSFPAALARLRQLAANEGETLDILVYDGYTPPPAETGHPAGNYHIRLDNNKTLTVGGVPVNLEVSE